MSVEPPASGHCSPPASGSPRRLFDLQPPACLLAIAALTLLAAVGGCAGYRIGARSMFPSDVQTVYVPLFESTSFRRNLGERLTEAVMKQIESRSPFKVVNSPSADSVLTGRIVGEQKRIVVETPSDEGRSVEYNMVVEVTWVDRHGGFLQPTAHIPVPPSLATIQQTGDLVPEFGQSVSTAQQEVIDRLASQIVSLMEAPW